MALQQKGSAAAAYAVPESAGEDAPGSSSYALRTERELVTSRAAALAAAEELRRLPADAAPGVVAAVASRLESAAGDLWMRARRVVEARGAT